MGRGVHDNTLARADREVAQAEKRYFSLAEQDARSLSFFDLNGGIQPTAPAPPVRPGKLAFSERPRSGEVMPTGNWSPGDVGKSIADAVNQNMTGTAQITVRVETSADLRAEFQSIVKDGMRNVVVNAAGPGSSGRSLTDQGGAGRD